MTNDPTNFAYNPNTGNFDIDVNKLTQNQSNAVTQSQQTPAALARGAFSPLDRDLAIRTMLGEEGSVAGQAGVAATILNRAQTGRFGGSSLAKVVLAPNQFEPWGTKPNELLSYSQDDPAYRRAASIFDAVSSGQIGDPTGGATFFYAPKAQRALGRPAPSWANGQATRLGSTLFYADPQHGPVSNAPAVQAISDATASPSGNPQPMPSSPPPTQTADNDIDYVSMLQKQRAAGGSSPSQPAAASSSSSTDDGPDYVGQLRKAYQEKTEPPKSVPETTQPAKPGFLEGARDTALSAIAPGGGMLNRAEAAAKAAISPFIYTTPGDSFRERYSNALADQDIGPTDAARAVATGVPIIGGLLNKADAATNAVLAPAFNRFFDPSNQLQGDTFSERYDNALKEQNQNDKDFAAAHPVVNFGLNTVGGIGAMAPIMKAFPTAFGVAEKAVPFQNLGFGAASGAALGAADTATRGDFSPQGLLKGAIFGGGLSAGAQGLGAAVGTAGKWAINKLSGTTPEARRMSNILSEVGITPSDAEASLAASGPAARIRDLDPGITGNAVALAQRGGLTATSILEKDAKAREAGADDLMAKTVNDSLGAAPDTEAIVNSINNRKIGNAVTPEAAQAALDNSMGRAADPHDIYDQTRLTQRANAAPLYKTALDKPVIGDPILDDFMANPRIKEATGRGVKIQIDDSTGTNVPFNPTDYNLRFDANGEPEIVGYPNMKTLDVIKNGLDQIVDSHRDAFGNIDKEGRSIALMRDRYVAKLDSMNPDYEKARAAWAGPAQVKDAWNRGYTLFSNQSGPAGVESTPGALKAWLNDPIRTQSEKDAAIQGARSAFQQQMTGSVDPVSKATSIANKAANQQKLATLLGPDEANNLVKQLTFKYEDPQGAAFSKGLNAFQNRTGEAGLQDTPQALKSWMKTASSEEITAHQQGARQAIEQALSAARNGDLSQAQSMFGKSTANREKLEAVFPEAKKMLDQIDTQIQQRAVDQKIIHGSQTAKNLAAGAEYGPPSSSENSLGPIIGELAVNSPEAAGAGITMKLMDSMHRGLTADARKRTNEGIARLYTASGPDLAGAMGQIHRAAKTNWLNNAFASGSAFVPQLGANAAGAPLRNYFSTPQDAQ